MDATKTLTVNLLQRDAIEALAITHWQNVDAGEYPDDGTQGAIEGLLVAFGLPLYCPHEWEESPGMRECHWCHLTQYDDDDEEGEDD